MSKLAPMIEIDQQFWGEYQARGMVSEHWISNCHWAIRRDRVSNEHSFQDTHSTSRIIPWIDTVTIVSDEEFTGQFPRPECWYEPTPWLFEEKVFWRVFRGNNGVLVPIKADYADHLGLRMVFGKEPPGYYIDAAVPESATVLIASGRIALDTSIFH